MNTPPPIAWVDESGSDSRLDPGTYIMAATLIPQDEVLTVKASMDGLLLPGQAKLHWRDERPSRQLKITETLLGLDLKHVVVVTTHHQASSKPQRRRHLTLKHLLPILSDIGVQQAVFESRGPADDNRDVAMLQKLRQGRLLHGSIRVDHAVGRTEPLLWVPDAICGVISAQRTNSLQFFDLIQDSITLLEFPK